MYTDKLFTGQRSLAGLGIYHYGARFYSPYINRFLSADTVVPEYTNPQELNRFSYVLNNPLRYTDPTGHMMVEESGGTSGCSNPKYCQNGKPKPPVKHDNKSTSECKTVTCRALGGDLSAIIDLIIPTHIGWRGQFELSTSPLQIFPGVGVGPSGTLGVNVVYNGVSGEFAAFADWTVEGGGGIGTPVGASFTEGPVVGWGSSTVKDVAQGNSATISGTAAYEAAVSLAISAPVEGDSLKNIQPHVDPIYGQIPATVYAGGGIGGAYAGAGGGGSHVFLSTIIDFFP